MQELIMRDSMGDIMKIFICADIEGVTTTNRWEEVISSNMVLLREHAFQDLNSM